LIQFAPIRGRLGPGRLFDGPKLDESVIFLHVDSHEFPKRFEEHLKIFSFRLGFVEVHHEQGFRGCDHLFAFIFLALDPSIPACEFGA